MNIVRGLGGLLPRVVRRCPSAGLSVRTMAHVSRPGELEQGIDEKSLNLRSRTRPGRTREQFSALDEVNIDLSKEDEDTFGAIGPREVLSSEYLPEDDDGYDKLEKMKRLKPFDTYEKRMVRLLHGKLPYKVKRAVELFEEMQRDNRMMPTKSHYTMLIMGCSHFGLAEQAFELYRQERKMFKFFPTKATITALFNSAANCEDKKLGLEKAIGLREGLYEEGYVYNTIQYNSMIKAFGKLGDLKTSFQIVKEMVENKHSITSETYCMLLMGCVSDKEAGFTHAVRIVRQMKRRKVPLTVYVFNLLLRCVRECGVGSEDHLKYLFHEWNEASKQSVAQVHCGEGDQKLSTSNTSRNQLLNNSTNGQTQTKNELFELQGDENSSSLQSSTPDKATTVVTLPNLLRTLSNEQKDSLVGFDFSCLKEPQNKLMLVGGLDGIFDMMHKARVSPTVATSTLLMDTIPSTVEAENALMTNLNSLNVKLDTDFFNMLIKRRCFRGDLKLARQTVTEMQARGFLPDIVTFGVMATGCSHAKQGLQLVGDLERAGFKLNAEIIGALVANACYRSDFDYLLKLLKLMESREIKPSPKLLENIVLTCHRAEDLLFQLEKGIRKGPYAPFTNDGFELSFDNFKLAYKEWLHVMEIDFPEKFTKQFEFTRTERPKKKFDDWEHQMKVMIAKRFDGELKAAQLSGYELPKSPM